MATINTPKIRTIISGDSITPLDSSTSFSLVEKYEITRLLKDTDGSVIIDYSYVDNIKTIYFDGDDVYTVTILLTDTNEIPFEINSGVFRFDPTSDFASLIDTISISTSSTTNITLNIRIYGTES